MAQPLAFQSPIHVVNDGVIKTVDEVLSIFEQLPLGSVYMQRVTRPEDVDIVSKLQQFTGYPLMKGMDGFVDYNVFSQFCSDCGCVAFKQRYETMRDSEYMKDSVFYKEAIRTQTDKVRKHRYHHLYGKWLRRWNKNNTGAMLEIGLGCNGVNTYNPGPGHSAKIWPHIFDHVHFVEFDGECVQDHLEEIKQLDIEVKVGDQGDVGFLEVLKYEIYRDVGPFEVVIDDGGHQNQQILTSFQSLWPMVKVGGMYFIEDFSESSNIRVKGRYDCTERPFGFRFGGDLPCTAQYFLQTLLRNLFCKVYSSGISCHDIKFMECTVNNCVIGK